MSPVDGPGLTRVPGADDDDRGAWSVFLVFLRLGLTSFGGPVAHLGYFHREFVIKRRWLDDAAYADLVALCQFLPGPAGSQLAILRARLLGGLATWTRDITIMVVR